jgi:hypothetical protein
MPRKGTKRQNNTQGLETRTKYRGGTPIGQNTGEELPLVKIPGRNSHWSKYRGGTPIGQQKK